MYFMHRSSVHTHALTKSPLHMKFFPPLHLHCLPDGCLTWFISTEVNMVAHLLSTIFCSFGEFVLVLLFFNKRFCDPF